MTDRIHSLTVALDRDIRDDDISPLMTSIRQLRGVLKVSAHAADINVHVAESRASAKWRDKIYKMLEEVD